MFLQYYKRQYEEAKKRKTAAAASAADEGRVKARAAAQELVALQQQREKELAPLPIGAGGRLGLAALPVPSLGLSRPSSGSELSLPSNREAAQRGQGDSGRSATAAVAASAINSAVVPLASRDSRIGSVAGGRLAAETVTSANAGSLSAVRRPLAAASPSVVKQLESASANTAMARSFELRPGPLALGHGPTLGSAGASFGKAAALAPLPALGALRSPTTTGAGTSSSMRSLSAGPALRKESLTRDMQANFEFAAPSQQAAASSAQAAGAASPGSSGSQQGLSAVHAALAPMRMSTGTTGSSGVGSDSKSGASSGFDATAVLSSLTTAARSLSAPATPLPRSGGDASAVAAKEKTATEAQPQARSGSDAVRDAALARARAQAAQVAALPQPALPQPVPAVFPPAIAASESPPAAVSMTAGLAAGGSNLSGQHEGHSPTASSTATAASRKSRERPTSASRTGRSDVSHCAGFGGQRGSLTRSTSGVQLPPPLVHGTGTASQAAGAARNDSAASRPGGRQGHAQVARGRALSPSLSDSGSGVSGKDDDRSSDEVVFRLHGPVGSDHPAGHGYGADSVGDAATLLALEEGEVTPGFVSESGISAVASASASASGSGSALLRASALLEQARALQVGLPDRAAATSLTGSASGDSFVVSASGRASSGMALGQQNRPHADAEVEWSDTRLRGSLPQAAASSSRRTSQPLSQAASDASLPERQDSARSLTADSVTTPMAETRRLLKQRAAGAHAGSGHTGSGSSLSPARIARELQAGTAGRSPVLSLSRLQRVASGSLRLHSPGRSRSPNGTATAAAAAASEAAALLASAHADTIAALRQSHAAQLAALEAEAAAHLVARRAALQEESSAVTATALASARRAEADELKRLREAAEQAAAAERAAAATEQQRIRDEQAAALAALRASQEAALAAARAASAEAVAAEQSRAEAELGRLQQEHAAELRRALQEQEAAAAAAAAAEDAVASEARLRHAAGVAALEASHASALAALRQELTVALEEEKAAGATAVAAARARAAADVAAAAAALATSEGAGSATSTSNGLASTAVPERPPTIPSALGTVPLDESASLPSTRKPPSTAAVSLAAPPAVAVVDVVAAVTDLRLNVASLRSQVEACLQHATPSQSVSASSGIASAAATAGPTPQAKDAVRAATTGAAASRSAAHMMHRLPVPAAQATALLLARSVLRFMQLEGGRLAAVQGALRERRLQLAKRRDELTMQRDAWREQARRLQAGAIAPIDRRLLARAGAPSGAATAGDDIAAPEHTPRASAVELLTAEADKQALRRSKTAIDEATARLNSRIAEYKLAEQHAAEMQRRFYQRSASVSGANREAGLQVNEVELAGALDCRNPRCCTHGPAVSNGLATLSDHDHTAAAERMVVHPMSPSRSSGRCGGSGAPSSAAVARWKLMSMHDAVAEVAAASMHATALAPPVPPERESAPQADDGVRHADEASCSAVTTAALLLMKMQQLQGELFGRGAVRPAAATAGATNIDTGNIPTTARGVKQAGADSAAATDAVERSALAEAATTQATASAAGGAVTSLQEAAQAPALRLTSGASALNRIMPLRLRVWPHEPVQLALHVFRHAVGTAAVTVRQRNPAAAGASASDDHHAAATAPEPHRAPQPAAEAAHLQLDLVLRDVLSSYLHHTGGHEVNRVVPESERAGAGDGAQPEPAFPVHGQAQSMASVAGRFWRHDRSVVIDSALREATQRLQTVAAAQVAHAAADSGSVAPRAISPAASTTASQASSWTRPERALGLSDMASVATLGTTTTVTPSHAGRGRGRGRGRHSDARRHGDASSRLSGVTGVGSDRRRSDGYNDAAGALAHSEYDGIIAADDDGDDEAAESTGAFEALSPTRFGYDSVSVAGVGAGAGAAAAPGEPAHSRPQLLDPEERYRPEDVHMHERFDPRARRFSTATGLSVSSRKLVASSPHYPHQPPGKPQEHHRDRAGEESGSHAKWRSRRSSSRSGKRAQGRRVSISHSAQRSQTSSAVSPASTPASASSRSAGAPRRSASRSSRHARQPSTARAKATQLARASRHDSDASATRRDRPGRTSSAPRAYDASQPLPWPAGMPFPFPFPQAWMPPGWPYGMGHGMTPLPPQSYGLGMTEPNCGSPFASASLGLPLYMAHAAPPLVPPRQREASGRAAAAPTARERATTGFEPASRREPSWQLQARSMQRQVQSHTAWLQGLAQTMAATSRLRALPALLPATVTLPLAASKGGAAALFAEDYGDDAADASPMSFEVDVPVETDRGAHHTSQPQRESKPLMQAAGQGGRAPLERTSSAPASPVNASAATAAGDAARQRATAAEAAQSSSGGHGTLAADGAGAAESDALASAAPLKAATGDINRSTGITDASGLSSSSSSSSSAARRYESSAFLAAARQRRESERERSAMLQQAILTGSRAAEPAAAASRFGMHAGVFDHDDDEDEEDSPLDDGVRSEQSSGSY